MNAPPPTWTVTTTTGSPLPPAIERSRSVRAALWIHNHPKSMVCALLVLAAGYGLALGLGGLSTDALLSVATVGGVVLLVSAYVLKRLIWMPEIKRLQYLFGINDLKHGDTIYCNDKNGVAISMKIMADDLDEDEAAWLMTTPEGSQFLTDMYASTDLSNPSEELLSKLRQTILENENRSILEKLSWVFGANAQDGIPEKVKIIDQNTAYEIEFFQKDGTGTWHVKLPSALHDKLFKTKPQDGVQEYERPLIGPRFDSPTLVNYLRNATIQTWTKWSKV